MRIKTWGKMIFDEIFIFEMYRSKMNTTTADLLIKYQVQTLLINFVECLSIKFH